MPKTKTDYSKTLIYKIVCNDLEIKDCYIGHTTNWVSRKSAHKYNCNDPNKKEYNINVYKFIRENGGWDNWSMIEIKKYPCNDKREAEAEERRCIELEYATLNCHRPFVTKDERKQENQERLKKYYEANAYKLKEYQKKYNDDNADKIKERQNKYNEEHKDKIKETQKKYQKDNADKIKGYKKKYAQDNADKIKQKAKEYREANRDKIKECQKKWYEKKKEQNKMNTKN